MIYKLYIIVIWWCVGGGKPPGGHELRRLFLLAAPLAALALAAGCGGKGTGQADDPNAPKVTLSASRTLVKPGEAVALSWTSRNAAQVDSSNLGTQSVNGTVTVAPTFTSDYAISVSGTGGRSRAGVRVMVDRPAPRFAVVGDPSDPEVPQIQAALMQAGAVSVGPGLPSDASTYDALVIHGSGSVSPADRPAVESALAAGKGVVLVGLAPSRLSTGLAAFTTNGSATDEKLDTAAVAAWFGGVTELDKGLGGGVSMPYAAKVDLPYFALPASLVDPDKEPYLSGNGDDPRLPRVGSGRVGAAAYRVLASSGFFSDDSTAAFAFRVPSGGRVYWQWHSSGFDPASQADVSAIFRAGATWAACP